MVFVYGLLIVCVLVRDFRRLVGWCILAHIDRGNGRAGQMGSVGLVWRTCGTKTGRTNVTVGKNAIDGTNVLGRTNVIDGTNVLDVSVVINLTD